MKIVRWKIGRLLWFLFPCGCLILLGIYLGSSMELSESSIFDAFKMRSDDNFEVQFIDGNSYKQKLKAIVNAEYKYEELYKSLTDKEISNLTKHHNHNVTLYWSKSGPLHRMSTPQSRSLFDRDCIKYIDRQYTESVSIIMCHKNELVYSLLRVLTAIDERTPKDVLKEVLIIDDGSDRDDSAEILEYGRQLGMSIRTLRQTKSIGIANCRNLGIRKAKSEVVVILDSHMEVSDLWLEPLLDTLHSKPRSLAVPQVIMTDERYYKETVKQDFYPYFTELLFGYSTMHWIFGGPSQDNRTQPFPSGSLSGGAIAAYKSTLLDFYPNSITKDYLWGVENNRVALRAWLCGDGVWISGCSQITHLSGPDLGLHRYGGWQVMKNVLERESMAEILNFMENDEERAILLDRTFLNDDHNQEIYDMAHSISQEFDHRALCSKNYKWYLQNVHLTMHYQFLESPDLLYVGEIQSTDGKHCLHCKYGSSEGIFVEPSCRKEDVKVFWDTHMFGFGKNGAVYTSHPLIMCWDAVSQKEGARIYQFGCHSKSFSGPVYKTQTFFYNQTSMQIRHPSTNRCVELAKTGTEVQAYLKTCNTNESQRWIINSPKWRLIG